MLVVVSRVRGSGLELMPYDTLQAFTTGASDARTYAYPQTQAQILSTLGNGVGVPGSCDNPQVTAAEALEHEAVPNVRNPPRLHPGAGALHRAVDCQLW